MSNWWINGDVSQEDMGAIIKGIREDHLKMDQQSLADKIGVKLGTLQSSERGKGNHIDNVLRRICDEYNLKSEITIKQ